MHEVDGKKDGNSGYLNCYKCNRLKILRLLVFVSQ